VGHIVKRKDRPGYIVRWIDPDGRERSYSKDLKRKTDAERFLHSIEGSKLQGNYVDPWKARRPFGEVVAEFKAKRGGSAGTRARDDSAFGAISCRASAGCPSALSPRQRYRHGSTR
jgi:hypothetical protein